MGDLIRLLIDDPAQAIGSPIWLHAIWLAPAAMALASFAAAMRRRALRRFAGQNLPESSASPARRWTKSSLVAASIGLVAVALAQPRANPEEITADRRGRDVVFVVDVSRSMLATDLAPTRLDRARLWMKDLAASLEGDRVGLVAFAGGASIACPLTVDRAYFGLAVDELSVRSVRRGGTQIGDAIRKTVRDVFGVRPDEDDPNANFRDIILITDGEDQGSLPVEAARAAGEAGVRIIAIGIGSSERGAEVPAPDDEGGGALRFEGQAVRSRMDPQALAEIAGATPGGAFLNVGTGTIDLEQVYADLIAGADRRVVGAATAVAYDEYFWVFLAAAIVLLTVDRTISNQRTTPRDARRTTP